MIASPIPPHAAEPLHVIWTLRLICLELTDSYSAHCVLAPPTVGHEIFVKPDPALSVGAAVWPMKPMIKSFELLVDKVQDAGDTLPVALQGIPLFESKMVVVLASETPNPRQASLPAPPNLQVTLTEPEDDHTV
jgi:hypothetical protein